MKIYSKIKQRLFRGYFRIGAHIHVRHWRGHGIHSPFMYGIVRNVFMKSRITGSDTSLYEALRGERIGKKNAVKLQNLYTHCRMDGYTLVPDIGAAPDGDHTLYILLPDVAMETIVSTAREAAACRGSLVILSPHRSARCRRLARQIREHYPCVSVDRKLMMIYFFSPKLQPQHYII